MGDVTQAKNYLMGNFHLWEIRNIVAACTEMLNLNGRPFSLHEAEECTLCNLRVTEDVIHFLGECPVLAQFRVQIFHRRILLFQECLVILKTPENWSKLANYVKYAGRYRQELIMEYNG